MYTRADIRSFVDRKNLSEDTRGEIDGRFGIVCDSRGRISAHDIYYVLESPQLAHAFLTEGEAAFGLQRLAFV